MADSRPLINKIGDKKAAERDRADLEARPSSHDAVIKLLLDGNARWAAGTSTHPRIGVAQRERVAQEGQRPFAAILSCSDSRVPSELLFDVGLGDLFVVRVAGHSLDKVVTQSLQYAAEILEVKTIFVMGHQNCGAVTGAVETYPASAPELLSAIYPAITEARYVLAARGENADDRAALTREAIDRHVIAAVKQLKISFGGVAVVGARYDLHSGRIMMLVE